MDFLAAAKLSELKRWITLDARVDLFAFFVPHRAVYGDAWETMIKDGIQGARTLSDTTVGYTGGSPMSYLGTQPVTNDIQDAPSLSNNNQTSP